MAGVPADWTHVTWHGAPSREGVFRVCCVGDCVFWLGPWLCDVRVPVPLCE